MIFEVGKEYWLIYGTTEEQSHACVKVIAVEGQWLKVESKELDTHLNMAAPMFISARERNREAEDAVQMRDIIFVDHEGKETGRLSPVRTEDTI
ncbi:hypothetical protein [uncultured Sphingomonas sp.]|uniref:hypothetical protein n=1 Tax=uncultured Sphingomonas sp. TaxID=158754 RepID=UPI0035CA3EFE